MKRSLCLLLALTLFISYSPTAFSAAEDTFALTPEEVCRIESLAGDTGVWREGMSYSDAMSAYQKYCWLRDFLDNELATAENRSNALQHRKGALADDAAAEAAGMHTVIIERKQLIQYWIFELNSEIQAVSQCRTILSDNADTSANRAAVYRRMKKAGDRLTELNLEISDAHPGRFKQEFDEILSRIGELSEELPPIVSGMTGTATPDSASDFRILILDVNQIGFEIHAADMTQLSGAKVTFTSGGITRTGISDASGTVLFDAAAFNTDSYHRLWAEVRVEKDGYRIWESKSMRVVGGEGVKILMDKDNGDSYVQYVNFRDVDILHGEETVWSTPENDARQVFEVGIHNKAGKPGVFAVDYTDAATGKAASVTVRADGGEDTVQTFDLSDSWCSKFQADQPVTLTYTSDSNTVSTGLDRSDAIKVEKAVVQSPIKSLTPNQQIFTGTAFNISFPTGLPVMKQFSLGFNFPEQILDAVPVNVSVTPNGKVVLGVGIGAVKQIADNANSSWKTDNGIKVKETWSDLSRNRTSLTMLAEKSTQARGQRSSALDLFHTKFNVYFMAMLTGEVKANKAADADSAYTGAMDLFFSVGVNATVSFKESFMAGPVPCTVGFDFTAGVQFGVTVPFTFKTDSSRFLDFVNWRDFSFQKEALDIAVGLRTMINVYGGVGIKGVAALYIRGYFGAAVTLHIRPYQDNKVAAEGFISAGIQLVAELLFLTFKADIVSWNTPVPVPDKAVSALSSAGEPGEPAAVPEYVTATVKALGGLDGSTVKTVQSGNDFYCFYISEATVNGRKRPWLKALRISPDKTGAAAMTDLPLTDLGLGAYAGSIPDDAEVVDFSVATLNDVLQKEGSAELIALHVFFQQTEPGIMGWYGYNTELYCIYRSAGESLSPAEKAQTQISLKCSSGYSRNGRDSVINCSVTIADAPVEKGIEEDGVCLPYYITLSNSTSSQPREYSTRSYWLDIYDDEKVVLRQWADGNGYQSVSGALYESVEQAVIVTKGSRQAESYFLCKRKDNGQNDFIAVLRKDYSEEEKITLSGDFQSFKYMPDTEDNGLIALIGNPDDTGRCNVYLCDVTHPTATRKGALSEPRDMGITVSPANYEFVNLGKSRALYYLNQSFSEDPRYEIIAFYLAPSADGTLFATAPFHLAVFRPEDLSVQKGVTGFSLFSDNSGFLQGFVYEKSSDAAAASSARYFSFQQTLQIDIRDIITEDVLVQPGDTVNLLFSVLNNGNIPLNKAKLSAYGVREGTSDKIPLADIWLNFENPKDSLEYQYDVDGSVLYTTRGLRAASCYDSSYEDTQDTFTTGFPGRAAQVYATTVLMPDETHLYHTNFIVPDDFTAGDYRIFVAPIKLSTAVQPSGGRYQAVSAWTGSLIDQTSGTSAGPSTPVYLSATVRTDMPLNTAKSSAAVSSGTVPVSLQLENAEGRPAVQSDDSPYRLSGFSLRSLADSKELDLDFADLSITAAISHQAGTELVHAVIRNLSSSPVHDPVITALTDGKETYRSTLSGVTLRYDETISLDLPLSKLTSGRKADSLTLVVDSTGSEANPDNNDVTLDVNQLLKILRQPEDQTRASGGDAEFSVTAVGGKKPYTYQWQKSTDGRNGTFINIGGAGSAILTLHEISDADNTTCYRCVVRDADGSTVTSSSALLLVMKKPPLTGDTTPLALYLLLPAVSVVLLIMLCKKRSRKHR